ncbi:MAG: hypothetical protein HC901_04715, partial [Bdellovibrionaceae bacterium]|nr:hypothetical protein [Pseudobdellovibrionaceae bacterium]
MLPYVVNTIENRYDVDLHGGVVAVASAQTFRAGETGSGKPYMISATVREEYDSNVGTTSTNEDGSWVTSVAPKITFDYPLENTVFSAGYRFDARFYHQRGDAEEDEEFGHDFYLNVDHDFTDRLSVSLRENFNFDQESELESAGTTRRLGGNRIRNTGGIEAS